jgi:hypothetical protein
LPQSKNPTGYYLYYSVNFPSVRRTSRRRRRQVLLIRLLDRSPPLLPSPAFCTTLDLIASLDYLISSFPSKKPDYPISSLPSKNPTGLNFPSVPWTSRRCRRQVLLIGLLHHSPPPSPAYKRTSCIHSLGLSPLSPSPTYRIIRLSFQKSLFFDIISCKTHNNGILCSSLVCHLSRGYTFAPSVRR